MDLGWSGPSFTWTNKRKGFAHIKERLDKAVGNAEWRIEFPDVMIQVLSAVGSNHSPLLLTLNSKGPKVCRPFRFFNMWLRDKSCLDLIKNSWHVGRTID